MSIDLTRKNELALITLNRPQVHNALSDARQFLDGKEGTRAFLEKRKPRFQDL